VHVDAECAGCRRGSGRVEGKRGTRNDRSTTETRRQPVKPTERPSTAQRTAAPRSRVLILRSASVPRSVVFSTACRGLCAHTSRKRWWWRRSLRNIARRRKCTARRAGSFAHMPSSDRPDPQRVPRGLRRGRRRRDATRRQRRGHGGGDEATRGTRHPSINQPRERRLP
jgi:hypothetical protein